MAKTYLALLAQAQQHGNEAVELLNTASDWQLPSFRQHQPMASISQW